MAKRCLLRMTTLVLILAGGCARPGVDLAESLPRAGLRIDVAQVDFSSREIRSQLRGRWSAPSTIGKQAGAWAIGTRSEVVVSLDEPRDRELILVCWSVNAPQLPRIKMAVRINGKPVTTLVLESDEGATYQVPVPARYWLEGDNRLSFKYSHTIQPAAVFIGATDQRQLAAAWSQLRVTEAVDLQQPPWSSLAEASSLKIPQATEISYELDIEPGADLVLDSLAVTDSPDSSRLRLTMRSAITSLPQVMEVKPFSATEGPRRVPLPVDWPQTVTLGLSMTTDSQPPRPPSNHPSQRVGSMLELRRPRAELASLHSPGHEQAPVPAAATNTNVIIYLIDALRADHLGCYGYSRAISPNLDSFAEDCLLFPNTMAQSSWTKPAVSSLLSGLNPVVHGVSSARSVLPQEVTTMAELLQAAGYTTSAVVSNGVVSGRYGFSQGFDSFEHLPEQHRSQQVHHLSDRVNEAAFDWLEQRDRSRPFLLYLHTSDPHSPYTPPARFRQQLASFVTDPELGLRAHVRGLDKRRERIPAHEVRAITALYDAEIAFNDSSFGIFIDRLKALDLYDSSLIVVLGDHGEELYDHGRWRHSYSLFQELLRVPLMIKLPQQEMAGRKPDTIARQIDILPTILDELGLPCPAGIEGRSLITAATAPAAAPATFAWLDTSRDLRAVLVGDLKLIEYHRYDRPHPPVALYDLSTDPGERTNLAEHNQDQVARLRALIPKRSAPAFAPIWIKPGHKLEEQLRALGYIE
jgi:arylsulfatase A-like enzyme